MIYIGIDPGITTGALVAITKQGTYVGSHAGFPSIGKEIDLKKLVHIIERLADERQKAVVIMEGLPMPFPGSKGGKGSYMTQGRNWGVIRGLLYGMGLEVRTVSPRTWTAVMHKGQPGGIPSKKKSYRLFTHDLNLDPELIFETRAKGKLEGLIDAYLIALYGTQTFS